MRHENHRWLLALLVVTFVTMPGGDLLAAEDSEEEPAYEEGPSVRRQLLYRSGRVELQPTVAISAGDAYMRNLMAGANLSYYFTNGIGIGLTGAYGAFHPETKLGGNVRQALADNADPNSSSLNYSYTQWTAGLEFKFVPIFGKFNLMNNTVVRYDFHLMAGMTVIGQDACTANSASADCMESEGGQIDDSLVGVRPAATLGLGARVFLGDAYAINLQVRDQLYRRAELSTSAGDNAEFTNNLFVSLGFSFFLPQSVKVAR
jgi:outer membrane beta-barrel protein